MSGSTYSYAYHALGELVAMVIAACVLLEYGVAASAVAVGWSGYFNELLDKTLRLAACRDALSYSPIPVEDGTTGLINLPAVVLVVLCTLLLIRGASESAKVNTVMVLIKLGVLVMFIVIGLHGVRRRPLRQLLGVRVGGHQRRGRHDLLLLHRPRRGLDRR